MISKEQLLDKLHVANQNFIQAPYDLFAITLYEFLFELDQQKISGLIDAYAAEEKSKDEIACSFIKAEEVLLLQLQAINKEIETYYQRESIPLSKLYFDGKCTTQSEFQEYKERKIVSSGNIVDLLVQAVSNSLSNLMREEGIREEALNLTEGLAIIKDGHVVRLRDSSAGGMQKSYSVINDFIVSKKILHPHINTLLQEFKEHGAIQNESKKLLYQNSSLITVLIIITQDHLKSARHLNFIQQFAVIDDKGQVIALKISPLIDDWYNEKKRLKRHQISTFWYGWYELKYFYRVHKDFENMRKDALYKGDLSLEWQLCDNIKKINGIASDKQPKYMRDLKHYEQKIFAHLKQIVIPTDQESLKGEVINPKKQTIQKKEIPVKLHIENNQITLYDTQRDESALFERYANKKGTQEEPYRWRVVILLAQHYPKPLSKKLIADNLQITVKQVTTACRGANEEIENKLRHLKKYIDARSITNKIKINDNYPTTIIWQ